MFADFAQRVDGSRDGFGGDGECNVQDYHFVWLDRRLDTYLSQLRYNSCEELRCSLPRPGAGAVPIRV